MQKIGILGAALGGIGGSILAALGRLSTMGHYSDLSPNVKPGKIRNNSSCCQSVVTVHNQLAREGWSLSEFRDEIGRRVRVWSNTRPADWHKRTVADPLTKRDVAAMRAAEVKRLRRASKMADHTERAFRANHAHNPRWGVAYGRLNPFHISR